MIKIRAAAKNDCRAIFRLSEQLGYPVGIQQIETTLEKIAPRDDSLLLVADTEEFAASGFIQLQLNYFIMMPPLCDIMALVVREDLRSMGIGIELLKVGESWARAKGMRMMKVNSSTSRQRAHRFYKKNGYILKKTQLFFMKDLDVEVPGPGAGKELD